MSRKPETIAFWRGNLPHWEVADGRYFVTLHLAGAIPPAGRKRIEEIATALNQLTAHDSEAWLKRQRQVFAAMESWLDRADQRPLLRDDRVARMVMEAIRFRHGRDWSILEFVVMPNHLHLFFELLPAPERNAPDGCRLKHVLEQFKRWTGHRAGELLGLHGEAFWQDEWFDHWSRSDEEDERIIEYIRRNPVKAKLVSDYRDWPFGSWRW